MAINITRLKDNLSSLIDSSSDGSYSLQAHGKNLIKATLFCIDSQISLLQEFLDYFKDENKHKQQGFSPDFLAMYTCIENRVKELNVMKTELSCK